MSKVYVLGGAQTDFRRNWSKEGKIFKAMIRESLSDAFRATGVNYADIEALKAKNKVSAFIGNFAGELFTNQGQSGALLTEISPVFYGVPAARYEAGEASGSAALDAAVTKIKAGDCDLAVVVGWEAVKTVKTTPARENLRISADFDTEARYSEFALHGLFGKLTDEVIARYGVDEAAFMEALADVCVKNHSNAVGNPNAQTRRRFMNKAQAMSRGIETNELIGGKLSVSDTSPLTDGAAVLFLASDKFAKSAGCPVIKGRGFCVAPLTLEAKLAESRGAGYILPWTKKAAGDAYAQAGVDASGVDFFEVADAFTICELLALSALGIAEPGKEADAIRAGVTARGGAKPVNPSGGLLGGGHPAGASGVRMMLDLYKQLTGKAAGYQVSKAGNGMMLDIGGTATSNFAFIVGKE